MPRPRTSWFLAPAALLLLAASAGLTLRAQNRPAAPTPVPAQTNSAQTNSVQDALLRPFSFNFAKPTPLDEAVKQLSRMLNAPVAIDRAAVERLGLKVDDEVQLELEGVRLKTGLKLLLDQLDLTFKVVPEDNLLIITDATGSADPIDEIFNQLKSLHRDLHETQDAVDEIRAALGIDGEEGAKVRKPTIIEEMPNPPGTEPDKAKPKAKELPPASVSPRSRPGI